MKNDFAKNIFHPQEFRPFCRQQNVLLVLKFETLAIFSLLTTKIRSTIAFINNWL
jgi:hypothetical protein